MKKNNWFSGKTDFEQDWILLSGILLFCLIVRLIYFNFQIHYYFDLDSVTYFAPVNIFKGEVNLYRTPVYPFIIHFFKSLSKEYFPKNLILFQQIISYLSIIPFYFIARRIINNKYIVLIATIVFGAYSPFLYQNENVETESLAIAGSILLLYILIRYYDRPSRLNAIYISLFSLILIMLRPSYLVLLPIILLFFIFQLIVFKKEKLFIFYGFAGWVISVICILGYCEMNKKHNGEFVITNISLINAISNITISDAYKYGGDKEFISIIDSTKEESYYYGAYFLDHGYFDNFKMCYPKIAPYVHDDSEMAKNVVFFSQPKKGNFSAERVNKFVRKSQLTPIYFKYILTRIKSLFLWDKYFLFILLAHTAGIAYLFLKRLKVAWIHAFMIAFIFGQFLTIAIGGIYNWTRLLIPISPYKLLIIASTLSILIGSFDLKKFGDSSYKGD